MKTIVTTPYEIMVSREKKKILPQNHPIYLFLKPEDFPREIPERLITIGRVPLKKVSKNFHSPSRFDGMNVLLDTIDSVLSNGIFYTQGLMLFDRFFTHSFRMRTLRGNLQNTLKKIFLEVSQNDSDENSEGFLNLFATIIGLVTGITIIDSDESLSSVFRDIDEIVKEHVATSHVS